MRRRKMKLVRHCNGCNMDYKKSLLIVSTLVLASAIFQLYKFQYQNIALNKTVGVKEAFSVDATLKPNTSVLTLDSLMNSTASDLFTSSSKEEGIIPPLESPDYEDGVATEEFDNSTIFLPPPIDISASNGNTNLPKIETSIRSLSPEYQLMYAKKEIENAPIVSDDPELYGPIFRNVSVFKRSYELMEKILKVYIYKEGNRPIFHKPNIKGIYASEGWFMKLMEGNKQFVVKDGNKAHLFYLPYGAHQLEIALYNPNLHSIRPLSIFLRNYVNMIAKKYPFWNRKHGSDHFFVACHDWAPYTTKEHKELRNYTIKALCNADISEGIFVTGKDVSLPETTIRNPRNPLRAIGGKPVSQRSILAFFAGKMHGPVRPILRKYWEGKDEDMKIYGPLPSRVSKNMSYIQHMKSSKFCICPMGYEVNSPRIVESIYYECVPVIISDRLILPLSDVLEWSAFSVVVAEKDIPKLKQILLSIPMKKYMSMQANLKRLQRHFLWHGRPIKYDMFHMILHSIWFSRLNQVEIRPE